MRLERAINAAACSLLFAGLGQLLQGRREVALWHCLEFLSLFAFGVVDEAHRPLSFGLALTVNAWSIIDAFVWESRRPRAAAR